MRSIQLVVLMIFCSSVYCLNGTNETDTDARKRYGWGFYDECEDYSKVFRCMTKCKSLAYGVYKLSRNCTCTCFEVSTVPILPYYKWITTGTTMKLPRTRSPRLYELVGTLSRNPYPTTADPTLNTTSTCPTLPTDSKAIAAAGRKSFATTAQQRSGNATSSIKSSSASVTSETESVATATDSTASSNVSEASIDTTTVSNTTVVSVSKATEVAAAAGRKKNGIKIVTTVEQRSGNATSSSESSSSSVTSEIESVANATESTATSSVSEASIDTPTVSNETVVTVPKATEVAAAVGSKKNGITKATTAQQRSGNATSSIDSSSGSVTSETEAVAIATDPTASSSVTEASIDTRGSESGAETSSDKASHSAI